MWWGILQVGSAMLCHVNTTGFLSREAILLTHMGIRHVLVVRSVLCRIPSNVIVFVCRMCGGSRADSWKEKKSTSSYMWGMTPKVKEIELPKAMIIATKIPKFKEVKLQDWLLIPKVQRLWLLLPYQRSKRSNYKSLIIATMIPNIKEVKVQKPVIMASTIPKFKEVMVEKALIISTKLEHLQV